MLSMELENWNVVQKALTGEKFYNVLISKYLELDKEPGEVKWESSVLYLQKAHQNSFKRLNTLESVSQETWIDLHEEGKIILWSNSEASSSLQLNIL